MNVTASFIKLWAVASLKAHFNFFVEWIVGLLTQSKIDYCSCYSVAEDLCGMLPSSWQSHLDEGVFQSPLVQFILQESCPGCENFQYHPMLQKLNEYFIKLFLTYFIR